MNQIIRTEQDDRVFVYAVDKDNRIVSVNQNWLDFAQENDAQELLEETVVGRQLWDFFSDQDTILMRQFIVAKVRSTHMPINWSCRCDSPSWYRIINCVASLLTGADIEFSNRFSAQYPRNPVAILDRTVPRSQEFMTLCSWCMGVMQNGRIVAFGYMKELLTHSSSKPLPQMRFRMCDDCFENQHVALSNRT